MKIAIVEDLVLVAEDLQNILVSCGWEVVGMAHTKLKGIEMLENTRPDLALLDINLHGGKEGIEIGEYISGKLKIPFIYITAYSEQPLIDQAVKTKPAGYIIKPFNRAGVYAAVKVVIEKLNTLSDNKFIVFKDGYTHVKLEQNDILYLKAEGNYVDIFTETKKYSVRYTLQSVQALLDKKIFVRIHRSFVVNVLKVKILHSKSLEINGESLPVSSNFYNEIAEMFKP